MGATTFSEQKPVFFNGKPISYKVVDGVIWLAIRPICEALGVDYHAQYKRLQNDPILGRLLSKQTTTGSNNARFKMVSLPEKYVYGWLFSVNSASESFQKFRMECYEVLFNHFRGSITGNTQENINRLAAIKLKKEKVTRELQGNEHFVEFMQLDSEEKKERRLISRQTNEQVMDLFNQGSA